MDNHFHLVVDNIKSVKLKGSCIQVYGNHTELYLCCSSSGFVGTWAESYISYDETYLAEVVRLL